MTFKHQSTKKDEPTRLQLVGEGNLRHRDRGENAHIWKYPNPGPKHAHGPSILHGATPPVGGACSLSSIGCPPASSASGTRHQCASSTKKHPKPGHFARFLSFRSEFCRIKNCFEVAQAIPTHPRLFRGDRSTFVLREFQARNCGHLLARLAQIWDK